MLEITSSSNNKCKYVKSLSQKKSRQKYGEYTIEGIKSVSDALNSEREIDGTYMYRTVFLKTKNSNIRKIFHYTRYKTTYL